MIPRTQDFNECSEPLSCEGLYYCGNIKATCYLRTCRDCNLLRGIEFPDYTNVPACVETVKSSIITAAIVSQADPRQVMRTTADVAQVNDVSKVTSQMVILSVETSTTTVVDIINTLSPIKKAEARPKLYTAYDITLGFFYEAYPDQDIDDVKDAFKRQIRLDTATIFDEIRSTLSVGDGGRGGRTPGIFMNTSDFQMTLTPATFAVLRCSDGTAVTGEEKCQVKDPALVNVAAAASHSTSSTTRLLTIILPIVGGVVFIALIIAAVVVVRRRRANKEQTEKHTEAEAAVVVTTA